MSYSQIPIRVAILCAIACGLHAQVSRQATTLPASQITTVRGRVQIVGTTAASKRRHEPIPGTVVWLTPMTQAEADATGTETTIAPPVPSSNLRLVQKNKSFEPHILVVPVGSNVEFPNRDPFFHNVFSLFEGKRFDLGLYEAGTSRMVRFDRPGISYIFCNIHPEMSAVVIALATPLYAISNPDGELNLPGVLYGRYMLHIWSEGMGAENTQPTTREITIAENASSLGIIRVPEVNGQHITKTNMAVITTIPHPTTLSIISNTRIST
jgi:plastocyanin